MSLTLILTLNPMETISNPNPNPPLALTLPLALALTLPLAEVSARTYYGVEAAFAIGARLALQRCRSCIPQADPCPSIHSPRCNPPAPIALAGPVAVGPNPSLHPLGRANSCGAL